MARVKGAMMTRKRRNATLKLAKGYWAGISLLSASAELHPTNNTNVRRNKNLIFI